MKYGIEFAGVRRRVRRDWVLAVRKVQSDRDFYAGLREAKAESEDWMPHALAHEEHERMPSEDLLRIVTALRIEAVAVGDRMSMVVGCLDGLIERMSNDECGMTNDEGRAA